MPKSELGLIPDVNQFQINISNENQIFQNPGSNSNQSPDLQISPAKSGKNQNLEIKPHSPDISAAHRSPRCQHVKSNGLPCGSPALRDEIYCYFHRIWRTQPDRQPFRPDPSGFVWNLPILEDPEGIQLALQMVLDSVLSNKMDLKRAGTLLYGLQTAAANVRRTHFDSAGFRKDITTELK
jgi:hypothetical protein